MCIEDMVAQQVRMAENAEIITEGWLATVTEPPSPRENSLILSKHIRCLPCSALREEALAMFKAKEDGRETLIATAKHKKKQAKEKKAKDTAHLAEYVPSHG